MGIQRKIVRRNGVFFGYWRQYADGTRCRQRLQAQTRAAAEKELSSLIVELNNPSLFGETAEAVLRQVVYGSSSRRRLRRVQLHLLPLLGAIPVGELTAEQVCEVLTKAPDAGRSRQLVRQIKRDACLVLRLLKRGGFMREDLSSKVQLPAEKGTSEQKGVASA